MSNPKYTHYVAIDEGLYDQLAAIDPKYAEHADKLTSILLREFIVRKKMSLLKDDVHDKLQNRPIGIQEGESL
jgi:Fe-S-cluster formation regulator IscX/YfhJ